MSDAPRVLLVDDDPAMLRLLEVNFRLEGFVVETASRGEEALHKATSHPPDAVVLDVMMPGMDGYEVGRGIKANPPTAELPIVFLTARAQDEDRETGLALGDVDYLTKPFDPAELVALVRRRVAGAGA